ncbi:MAG: hypothetical protein WC346_03620 [Methanogenium sp.]
MSHTTDLEAKNEQEAVKKYFESIAQNNMDLENFITSNLKIDRAFLASQLSGKALDKVLEDNYGINIEDDFGSVRDRDEAPFLDIEAFGLEINENQMSWNLDYPNRQLFFTFPHDGSGSRQIGICITNKNKLVKKLQKDLKLPERIAKAMRNEDISLNFRTQYFGGGDGRTYFEFSDNTEKGILGVTRVDGIKNVKLIYLEEKLQEWFDENIVNRLLKTFQATYDYLTSKDAIIETLDANEFMFTKDGHRL